MDEKIARKKTAKWRLTAALAAAVVILSSQAEATVDFTPLLCTILTEIKTAVLTVGSTLVLIMFAYGAVKYAFAADDPGGRKAGKMTCIHAIIGGILIVMYAAIESLVHVGWWNICPP